MKKNKLKLLGLPLLISLVIVSVPFITFAEDYLYIHTSYIDGFSSGEFKPNNTITREQALKVLSSEAIEGPPFAIPIPLKDTLPTNISENRWSAYFLSDSFRRGFTDAFYDEKTIDSDILNSYPLKVTFDPEKPVTRGQLVSILSDREWAFGYMDEPHKDVKFKDIKGHRFESQIIDIASRGIINGYNDDTFKPNKLVTRAEFVTIMNSALGRCKAKGINEKPISFKDVSEKDWFYYDVIEASVSHTYKVRDEDEYWIESLTEEEVDEYFENKYN